MRWVTCHAGRLQVRAESLEGPAGRGGEGLELGEGVASRAVHELLFDATLGHAAPMYPALWLARGWEAAETVPAGMTVWCDSEGVLYPPAVELAGMPVGRLCVLRPRREELVWAVGECLQTRGVGAVVASLPARLSRAEARRLQLAAERGDGVGLFMRPLGPGSDIYAAATRWVVSPARGERDVQRWNVRMVHGQGRHLGKTFLLEKRRGSRQANLVRLSTSLADRTAVPAAI